MRSEHRWLCCLLIVTLLLLTGCQNAAPQPPEEASTAPETPVQAEAEPLPEPEPEIEYDSFHPNYMRAADGFFRPDKVLTRAECAQLLYNLTAEPEQPEAELPPCPYGDVAPEAWYYEAVCCTAAYFTPTEELFRPADAATLTEFTDALCAALQFPEGEAPEALSAACSEIAAAAALEELPAELPDELSEDAPQPTLTRAQAAVLLNRALGRLPDAEAAESCPASLLLDVPEDRADYADIVEAVLPHAYCAEEDGELWQPEALEQSRYTSGVHLRGNSGYVVDEDGRVLRGSGLLTFQGQKFLRADETGRIFADGALHPLDGEAVYASQDGTLLTACTLEEGYSFDEDGYYTTGNEALDDAVQAAIAECTTEDMTQLEKLRACYDYVRAFKYLGRNAAFGPEVKVIPNDRLLEFGEKIFTTGKGDCYNFTAAFCLLARQLGYSAEPIVGECAYYWNWGGIAHGWVEVQIDGETWLFDPQIENYNLRAGLSNDDLSAFQVTYETAHASYRKH